MGKKIGSEKSFFSSTLFVCIIFGALLACFFNDVICAGKTLKASTTIAQVVATGPYAQEENRLRYIPYLDNTPAVLDEPYLEYKKKAFSRGVFPLWNPYQACGQPFFAGGQPAVLFPLSIALYLFPDMYAWDLSILLLLFLSGFLTFSFMRILGYPVIPSVVAGAAYMFSGPMITWMVFVSTNTTALIPLLFICVEKLIREQSGKWTLVSCLSIGMVIISGHPEHVFFAFLTTALYFFLRMICIKKVDAISRVRVIALACLALCVGALLASVFIFPLIEYVSHGWTSHHDKVGITSEEEPLKAITIMIPYFFQKVLMTVRYERAGWWGGYIGVMVVVLGLIGACMRDKDRNNLIFAAIAVFVISKCYGLWPVNLIGYLPLFNKLRYSLHYTQDFAFAAAILSGIGLGRLMDAKHRTKTLLFSVVAVALVIIAFIIYHGNKAAGVSSTLYAFLLLAASVVISYFARSRAVFAIGIAALLAAELYYVMPKEHARKYPSFPKVPYIQFLKEQAPRMRSFGLLWNLFPNTATAYGVDDVGVYEGLLVKRFVAYTKAFLSPDSFKEGGSFVPALRVWLPDLRSPFLDLVNVGYIIAPAQSREQDYIDAYAGQLVYSDEVKIYKRPTAFPRSFVAHKALFGKDEKDIIGLMKSNAADLRNTVIIEGPDDPALRSALGDDSAAGSSRAEIQTYKPNYIRISASLADPGILVLSDTYYPGWKVRVDGKESRILCADLLLRGVFLEKGEHVVEFSFKPFSFFAGLWVSILTLVGVASSGAYYYIRRRTAAPGRGETVSYG